MADVEAALVARLRGDAGVAALVGRRIDVEARPQGDALPAIVLQTVVDARAQHLKGFASLQSVTIQVDCWAATSATRRLVREAAIAALVPTAVALDCRFRRAGVEARAGTELVEGRTLYRASLDFTFHYSDV